MAADLLDRRTLKDCIPPGIDAVVYAASAGGFSDVEYEAAYVEGPQALLEALDRAAARPSRILFTSSIGVYGEDGGGWVDEDTPPEPRAFNGARVLQGEEILRSGPHPVVAFRLGGIYGPGRSSLVDRVREGGGCPAGAWSNRIHRDDCAGGLRHLLDLPEPDPIYIGVDPEPTPLCQVMRWIAGRLGVAEPAVEEGRGGRGRNRRCSSARLLASGYTFRVPSYREGFAPLLPAT